MKYNGVKRDISDIASGAGQAHNLIGGRLACDGEMRRRLCIQRANLANAGEPIRNMIGFNYAPGKTAANTFVASGGMNGNEGVGLAYPIGYIPTASFYLVSTAKYLHPAFYTAVYGSLTTDDSTNSNIFLADNAGSVHNISVSIAGGINNMAVSMDADTIMVQDSSNSQFHYINGSAPYGLSEVGSYVQNDFIYGVTGAHALCYGVWDARYTLRDVTDGTIHSATSTYFIQSPDWVCCDLLGTFQWATTYDSGQIVRINASMFELGLGDPGGTYSNRSCVLINGNVYTAQADNTVWLWDGSWTQFAGVDATDWGYIRPCEGAGYMVCPKPGEIELRSLTTMALIATIPTPEASYNITTLYNGRIYLNDYSGNLYTLDPQ